VASNLAADVEPLADELTAESGFLTRRDMVLEVQRAIDVFTLAAAAVREGFDELVNLAASPRGRDTYAMVRRVPFGPMLAITAFNGPILIATHKVAPAIAAGVPVVLKPSPRVPLAAVLFAERVLAAGWPADALSVLPVGNDETMELVRDPRLPPTPPSSRWTCLRGAASLMATPTSPPVKPMTRALRGRRLRALGPGVPVGSAHLRARDDL
jgi:acyl-CoA reductase-like NAD-dependent aldehyde dehydrogenase